MAAAKWRHFFSAVTDSAMPMEVRLLSSASSPSRTHTADSTKEEADGKAPERPLPASLSAFSDASLRTVGLSRLGQSTFQLEASWYTPLPCASSSSSSPFLPPSPTNGVGPHSPYVCVKNPLNAELLFLNVLQWPSSCLSEMSLATMARNGQIRIAPAAPPHRTLAMDKWARLDARRMPLEREGTASWPPSSSLGDGHTKAEEEEDVGPLPGWRPTTPPACSCFSPSSSIRPQRCHMQSLRALQPEVFHLAEHTFFAWLDAYTCGIRRVIKDEEDDTRRQRRGVPQPNEEGSGPALERRPPSHMRPSSTPEANPSGLSLLTMLLAAPCGVGKEMAVSYLYHHLTPFPHFFGGSRSGAWKRLPKTGGEKQAAEERLSEAPLSHSGHARLAEEEEVTCVYFISECRSLHFGSLLAMEAEEVTQAIAQVCRPPPVAPVEWDVVESEDEGVDPPPRPQAPSSPSAAVGGPPRLASSPPQRRRSRRLLCVPLLWLTWYDVDLLLPSTTSGGGGSAGSGFHAAVAWELLHQLEALSDRTISVTRPPADGPGTNDPHGGTRRWGPTSFSIHIPLPVVVWSVSTQHAPSFLLSEHGGGPSPHGSSPSSPPVDRKGTREDDGASDISSLHASASVALLSRLCHRGAGSSLFLTSPPLQPARWQYLHLLSCHLRRYATALANAAASSSASSFQEKREEKEVHHDTANAARKEEEGLPSLGHPRCASPSPPPLPALAIPPLETMSVEAFCAVLHQWGTSYVHSLSVWETSRHTEGKEKKEVVAHPHRMEIRSAAEPPRKKDERATSSPVRETTTTITTHIPPITKDAKEGQKMVHPSPFASFFGIDEVVQALHTRLLWPLTHLPLLRQFSIPCVKGAVLCGPSGSGKTALLAALAKYLQQASSSTPSPSAAWDGQDAADALWERRGPPSLSSPRAAYPPQALHVMVRDALTLVEKEVGKSEQNIAALFQEARAKAPTVLFLDNLEAIASPRGGVCPPASSSSSVSNGASSHGGGGENQSGPTDSSHTATDRMLSTLLVEMDGLHAHSTPPTLPSGCPTAAIASASSSSLPPLVVLVSSATSLHHLDPAVYRPGRLDVHLWLTLPSKEVCAEALHARLRPVLLDDPHSPLQPYRKRWPPRQGHAVRDAASASAASLSPPNENEIPAAVTRCGSRGWEKTLLRHLQALIHARYGLGESLPLGWTSPPTQTLSSPFLTQGETNATRRPVVVQMVPSAPTVFADAREITLALLLAWERWGRHLPSLDVPHGDTADADSRTHRTEAGTHRQSPAKNVEEKAAPQVDHPMKNSAEETTLETVGGRSIRDDSAASGKRTCEQSTDKEAIQGMGKERIADENEDTEVNEEEEEILAYCTKALEDAFLALD